MAIAGQWEPDAPFMIFTGYIDESDTHGNAPNMTMVAMLGSAGRWERCSRQLRRIQRDFGFSIFHATEFKGLTGEFEGWSGQKCHDLLMALGRLVADHLTECISVHCRYEVYKKHFLDVRPPKMHQTSQYGICFLAVLDWMSKIVLSQGPQHKLSVVVEDGHVNVADTARLFKERKARLEAMGADFLRSHSIVGKNDSPLLMLSDVASHGHAIEQREIKRGDAPQFTERTYPQPGPRQTGWTVNEVTPEYLAFLIEEFKKDGEAAKEAYLKRKAAWAAGKSSENGQPS